ncbi:MAG TPA: type II toxin-antitoxin system RelE/ParE family toxin [Firmicutes bacterium]|nr:type II toxin-antitoxin system RelE/ParE family toxin [Bacillota bacterium]
MYNVEFYENANGESELWNFLEALRIKASKSKDARIQYKQISLYIQLLQDNGTRLPSEVTKHIIHDIWELRPGHNRVLYFYFKDNTFVLLHQFRKKSQKTPRREIEKAISERNDYLARKEAEKHEDLE